MGILDLTRRRRAVLWGGRRFICGPPTVETVRLALTLYPREILAMAAGQQFAGDQAELTVDLGLPYFLSRPGLIGKVLESCVQVHQGGPGEVGEAVEKSDELARGLVLAVLDLCDIRQIIASLNLDQALQEAGEEDKPAEVPEVGDELDVQVFGVAIVARYFGTPPHEVMTWPYQEFLELAPCVERWRDDDLTLARLSAGGNGLAPRPASPTVKLGDDAGLETLGFRVHKAPTKEGSDG